MRPLLIATLALSLSACATGAGTGRSDCIRTRAAMDFGSAAFNLKVARVDVCLQKIEKLLLETSERTSFKDAARATGSLPPEALALGRATVAKFEKQARDEGATEFFAVGTQVFREISNSQEFFGTLPQAIQGRVVTQEQEAILGYAAATSRAGVSGPDVVVWDIGAGSMQMVRRTPEASFKMYLGRFAAHAARDLARETKDGRTPDLSPNPIGSRAAFRSVEKITKIARQELKTFPKDFKRVLGLGGVHVSSVMQQLKGAGQSYSREGLKAVIPAQSQKTDSELSSKHANTQVSNLILVLGFMQAAGIQQVEAVEANLADALLISGFSAIEARSP